VNIKRIEEEVEVEISEPEFPEIAELPAEAFAVDDSGRKEAERQVQVTKEKLMTQTEPVYTENGFIIIRNSKFGACPREIWAYASGIEPSREKNMSSDGNVFEEGHLHEESVREYCRRKFGWEFGNQEEEFNFRVGNVVIRGHADNGLLKIPDDSNEYCFEIKTFGHDAWEKWLTFGFDAYPGYLIQISVMAIALGRKPVFMGKNRDNGQKTEPIFWDEPPIPRVDIVKRAMAIRNAIEKKDMPDCGEARKFFQGWCLFGQLHKDEPIPRGSVIRPDLEWVLAKLKTMKKIKANEEEREELMRIVERELPMDENTPLICGALKAVRSSSMKIDRKKLANDFPDAYRSCLIKSDSKVKIMGARESGLGIDEDEE
jgi:hypothetical protein